MNRWDVIRIDWVDACASGGWQDLEGITIKPFHVTSIGMFLGEDDLHWTICTNDGYSYNRVSDTMSIPKGMITYVEVIKRAKED